MKSRTGLVTANQRCDLCQEPIVGTRFLYFPCTHAFKYEALLERVQAYRRRTDGLDEININAPEAEILAALGEKCPLCSDIMVDEVTMPFIGDDILSQEEA